MNVLVTGATGFVGRPLCAKFLEAGHGVTVLSRDAGRARAKLGPQVQSLAWGGSDLHWKHAIGEADIVIHLAGESVAAERWTPEFKEKIRRSRVETTRTLVDVIAGSERKPAVFVCASAVGYYGDGGDAVLTEESAPGTDFLGKVCVEWEREAERVREFGVREVHIRTGIVLGREGALEKLLYPLPLPISPAKLGLGGPLGNGKQWMPWIHIDDIVELFFWAATNAAVSGPLNGTAPHPVTNGDFMRAVGKALGRPAPFPVPAFALRLLLGEFAGSLLGGQNAIPAAAQRLGYVFHYPDLLPALRSLLASEGLSKK